MNDFDARLGALSNEAQSLVVGACELCANVGTQWAERDFAAVAKAMREAASKHRRAAELYDQIADECTRKGLS